MLETNIDRIKWLLDSLANFNETPGKGVTRSSFSSSYLNAQIFLIDELVSFGMQVTVTAHGNVRARLSGTKCDAPIVITGSHIDTVLHGGAYDGAVGVVAAIEVARTISEAKLDLYHPIEVIIFAEEEGTRFGSLLTGSKASIGELTYENLIHLHDKDCKSYIEYLKEVGIDPSKISTDIFRSTEIKAMLELHIEQSVVLEQIGKPVGLVVSIAGARQILVRIEGVANHAGATPMNARADALAATAEVINQIERIANTFSEAGAMTVATVGRIKCEPNVANVIPGNVEFTVDVRDAKLDALENALDTITNAIKSITKRRELKSSIELLSQTQPIELNTKILNELQMIAEMLRIPYARMISGAVHDSVIIGQIADVGMILVPSKGGRSHCPEEHSDINDIKCGADILLNGIIRLASQDVSILSDKLIS